MSFPAGQTSSSTGSAPARFRPRYCDPKPFLRCLLPRNSTTAPSSASVHRLYRLYPSSLPTFHPAVGMFAPIVLIHAAIDRAHCSRPVRRSRRSHPLRTDHARSLSDRSPRRERNERMRIMRQIAQGDPPSFAISIKAVRSVEL